MAAEMCKECDSPTGTNQTCCLRCGDMVPKGTMCCGFYADYNGKIGRCRRYGCSAYGPEYEQCTQCDPNDWGHSMMYHYILKTCRFCGERKESGACHTEEKRCCLVCRRLGDTKAAEKARKAIRKRRYNDFCAVPWTPALIQYARVFVDDVDDSWHTTFTQVLDQVAGELANA